MICPVTVAELLSELNLGGVAKDIKVDLRYGLLELRKRLYEQGIPDSIEGMNQLSIEALPQDYELLCFFYRDFDGFHVSEQADVFNLIITRS